MPSAIVTSIVLDSGDSRRIPKVTLQLASERVSTKELIERAVTKQISALREDACLKDREIPYLLNRQYLTDADLETMAKRGKIALPNVTKKPFGEPVSITAQQRKVLDAFRKDRFKIFVNGTELASLDECVVITENSKVIFLRMIPLTGG